MKKLIGFSLLVLAFGLFYKPPTVEAVQAARGAKMSTSILFTVTPASVSVSGPAVVYGVILSSGTAGTDYVVLFDSGAIAGNLPTTMTFKTKIIASSATQNTVVSFDPPLQFNSGIIAANNAATLWSTIIWEKGRVTQGY